MTRSCLCNFQKRRRLLLPSSKFPFLIINKKCLKIIIEIYFYESSTICGRNLI